MLTFTQYQNKAVETATFPEDPTGLNNLQDYVNEFVSEAGEVVGAVKRIRRDDGGVLTIERRDKIIDELGDALWGMAGIAHAIGVSLEHVAMMNNIKLGDRHTRGVICGEGGER